MTKNSRAHWDERYAAHPAPYGDRPSAWLRGQAPRLAPGSRLLLPADGDGRNGVWLASLGHEVTSVDFSGEALQRARRRAEQAGVCLHTIQADLRDWTWPEAAFDAVISLYLHVEPEDRPRLHRRMARALAPGGLLLLEGFHVDQLRYRTGGPPREDMLWSRDRIRRDFEGLRELELETCVLSLDQGAFHQGRAAVVRAVFRA